jgi:hypothetical protein
VRDGQTSLSGTRKLSPDDRLIARFGRGIRVPTVEARFRRTKLNKNGPLLSEAMEVPPLYVDNLKPPELLRCEHAELALEDHPHMLLSGKFVLMSN